MQQFTIPGLKFDAGELQVIVLATTGKNVDVSTDGNTVTLLQDLTQTEIQACAAAINVAPASNPATKPDAIKAAVSQATSAVNGKVITALTLAQAQLLIGLLLADKGWVGLSNGQYVVKIPQ